MNTKYLLTFIFGCFVNSLMWAQDSNNIQLNAPNKSRGLVFTKVLAERKSVREFDQQPLSIQDLSDLLWSANGVNRPDGKRTAPSAMNRQEIDIYAVLPDGAYLYDAELHLLKLVEPGDFRGAVAGKQEFVKEAPVSLVLVVNLNKLGSPPTEQARMMGAVDAGIVCQNINLFCSAIGLATVPRASMDIESLRKVLKLDEFQVILMNNPVGYPKK